MSTAVKCPVKVRVSRPDVATNGKGQRALERASARKSRSGVMSISAYDFAGSLRC